MASRELLDFDRLLAPLSDEAPCGESLRWDPVWDEISRLRKRQTDILGASEDVEPDWRRIVELAGGVLAERTKDLMIAGWLAEALVRTHGFAGLRDGLRLIRGYVENYWDGVYPEQEDGDLQVRAAPLVWLTDPDGGARLPNILREVPLAKSEDANVYSWAYWNSGTASAKQEGEQDSAFQKRKEEAARRRDQFNAAVIATPVQFYADLLEDIQQSQREMDALAVAADQRLGDEAPGWTMLRQTLAELEVTIKNILQEKGGLPRPAVEGGEAGNGAPAGREAHGGGRSGPIQTRAEAVARLQEAADYFRQCDPHSPVAYLIQRSIRWAGMSFEDLMKELVKDDSTFSRIGETLGFGKKEK